MLKVRGAYRVKCININLVSIAYYGRVLEFDMFVITNIEIFVGFMKKSILNNIIITPFNLLIFIISVDLSINGCTVFNE